MDISIDIMITLYAHPSLMHFNYNNFKKIFPKKILKFFIIVIK